MAAIQTNPIIQFNYLNILERWEAENIQTTVDGFEPKAVQSLLDLQQDDHEKRIEAKAYLESSKWRFLQFGHGSTYILESPSLPGWLFKCSAQWEKNIRRCSNAYKLSEFVSSHGFHHILIPKKAIIPIGNQYVVIAEKLPIVNPNRTIFMLAKHPQIKDIANQLCTLIQIKGLVDTHFDNICATVCGRVAIIDTDSVSESPEGAKAGLKNLMDLTKRCLKIIYDTAEQKLLSFS